MDKKINSSFNLMYETLCKKLEEQALLSQQELPEQQQIVNEKVESPKQKIQIKKQ